MATLAVRPAAKLPLAGSRLNSDTAKTDVVVAAVGAVDAAARRPRDARENQSSKRRTYEAARRPRDARVVAPGPAAQDAARAGVTAHPSRAVGRSALVVFVPIALRPLPDVTQHVVQSPRIGPFALDWMCPRPCMRVLLLRPTGTVVTVNEFKINSAVAAVPGHRIERRGVVLTQNRQIARVDRRPGSRPAGVFPLRFAGQRQIETGKPFVNLAKEALNVIPTHLLHRPGQTLESARIIPHHGFPHALRAGRVKQPVAVGQGDLMAGTFVIVTTRFTFWRTHPEPPRRNPAQAFSDFLQGEFNENAIPILSPTAGPVGWAASGQRMPGVVDDGYVHGGLRLNPDTAKANVVAAEIEMGRVASRRLHGACVVVPGSAA